MLGGSKFSILLYYIFPNNQYTHHWRRCQKLGGNDFPSRVDESSSSNKNNATLLHVEIKIRKIIEWRLQHFPQHIFPRISNDTQFHRLRSFDPTTTIAWHCCIQLCNLAAEWFVVAVVCLCWLGFSKIILMMVVENKDEWRHYHVKFWQPS